MGGALGSILGALGGGGNHQQQQSSDPMGGALGSIFGALGGGGNHQPQYQPSGGYQQPQQQGSDSIFSGIGSALFSSAMDGLNKHVSNKIKEGFEQNRKK